MKIAGATPPLPIGSTRGRSDRPSDQARAAGGTQFGTDRVLSFEVRWGAASRESQHVGRARRWEVVSLIREVVSMATYSTPRRLHSIPPLPVALHGSAFTAPRSVALRLTRRARSGTDFGPGFGPRAAAGRRSLVTWRSISWLHVTALVLRVGDMARH